MVSSFERAPANVDYKQYRQPKPAVSIFQLATSVAGFVALWALMWFSLQWSYALTLLLAVPTAGFLIRLFILQHDCGHRSFFRYRRTNDAVGFALGVLTLTPYHSWRRSHAVHHATSGDLDRRGTGDIHTITVREYLQLGFVRRWCYRLYRHPLVLLGLGGFLYFVVFQRFTRGLPRTWKKERASVHWTNACALALWLAVGWLVGFGPLLLIQLPVLLFGSFVGMWLFYVQHQFEDTYWQGKSDWDYFRAGLQGSSYYQLPKVLQWFTANIGLHHVHHLDSGIPNYRLQACLDENPELHHATRLTLRTSISCASLKLWDEDEQRLVGFAQARTRALATTSID